jgi:ABC-type uncharacterized transport system permease subunit
MLTTNAFTETRQVGDIDLVSEITNILASVGHKSPSAWVSDPIVQEAIGQHPKLQRFLINRFWRTQLGLCLESTTRERYCLVDTGIDTVYLEIFRIAVAPSIVKLNI